MPQTRYFSEPRRLHALFYYTTFYILKQEMWVYTACTQGSQRFKYNQPPLHLSKLLTRTPTANILFMQSFALIVNISILNLVPSEFLQNTSCKPDNPGICDSEDFWVMNRYPMIRSLANPIIGNQTFIHVLTQPNGNIFSNIFLAEERVRNRDNSDC